MIFRSFCQCWSCCRPVGLQTLCLAQHSFHRQASVVFRAVAHDVWLSFLGYGEKQIWQSLARIFRLLQVSTLRWIQSELPKLLNWRTFDQVNVWGCSLKLCLGAVSSGPDIICCSLYTQRHTVSFSRLWTWNSDLLFEELGIGHKEYADCRIRFYYSHLKEFVSRDDAMRVVGRLQTRRPRVLVRFLAGSSALSFVQSVQIVSGAYTTSCSMGPRGKAVGAWR
jgi:hypothetical protein